MKIQRILLLIFLSFILLSCKQEESYRATGYVEANLFHLASPIGGYLKELSVHEGESVKKDQKILKIDSQKYLTAPEAAEVVDVLFQKDEYVPPGYPIVNLLAPKHMKIIFFVPEQNLNKIKLGKQIAIFLNNQKYVGRIIYIGNQAEYTPENIYNEKNRNKIVYKVKAEIPNNLQELLKIGQPVDINYE